MWREGVACASDDDDDDNDYDVGDDEEAHTR